MKAPLSLWLWWHRRHGTGPALKHHTGARRLHPRTGTAVGEPLKVSWWRCECKAVRTVTRVPADG